MWSPDPSDLQLSTLWAAENPSFSELIIYLPLSAKSSYLSCCHFITGSSYQPAQGHMTSQSLLKASFLLIRNHHETGDMVYSRSLMLEKVQSPGEHGLAPFWILDFPPFFLTFTKGMRVTVVWGFLPKVTKYDKLQSFSRSMISAVSQRTANNLAKNVC